MISFNSNTLSFRRTSFSYVLQMIALKTRPALQRIMMPGASRQIFIHVQIAMRQNVEAGALLVANQHRHRILKFLAKPDIQHAGVERLPPHAGVIPARDAEKIRWLWWAERGRQWR